MNNWTLTQGYETRDGIVRWDRFGAGPPVVLLHGTPFSSYVWRDVAAALAADHEVYVWDMLGYGASDKHAGQDVSPRAQALIFAELLSHWGLQRPAVVAHDFGGAVALRAHLLHEANYERLALVDAVAHAPWGTGLFRLVRENPDVFPQLPTEVHEGALRAYVGTASHRGLADGTLSAYLAPWLGDEGQAAFYRQMAQGDESYTNDIQDSYGGLDLPVLVCWGTCDTWLPPEKGEQLAAAIPDARICWLRGAGHLVQEDAPTQLLSALKEFLANER
ncbi:alpha/beta fold hydrolase [Haloechinothrix alba]|nr:alpha/beta hydrolase [Haloechinothrix alba]